MRLGIALGDEGHSVVAQHALRIDLQRVEILAAEMGEHVHDGSPVRAQHAVGIEQLVEYPRDRRVTGKEVAAVAGRVGASGYRSHERRRDATRSV
jgi:hypothetical protein